MQGGPDPSRPAERTRPILSLDGCEGTNLDAGQVVQQPSGTPAGPPTTKQGDVGVPTQITPSPSIARVSLRSRMRNAPPTVTKRPRVTMCGHLFCFEYVLRIRGGVVLSLTRSEPDASHNTYYRLANVPCAAILSCCIVCFTSMYRFPRRNRVCNEENKAVTTTTKFEEF